MKIGVDDLLTPQALLSTAPVNVLVVDDVPQNLLAMRAMLEGDGVSVLTADSGRQALELLLQHQVAVALLDINMPEMSGFDLAELMRGSPRTADVPIIFLTASPSDPRRLFQGYESGAVDFLHKPVEPHVILSKVRVFTQLARQRELLRVRNRRLAHALQLNETMIAVMTHDLRTPLSVISLCAESMQMQAPGADRSKYTARIQESTHRMARMIAQLLDFSKIRNGVFSLGIEDADLAAIARQVAAEVGQAQPRATLDLDVRGQTHGRFDGDRISQVFSNLLGNAARHAVDGRVRVLVDGDDAGKLRIQVRNAGSIDPELLPRLFEPFKARFSASDGLGLGLYIVDQFVRAHGGGVEARNVDGEVVFDCWIPRVCAGAEETALAPAVVTAAALG